MNIDQHVYSRPNDTQPRTVYQPSLFQTNIHLRLPSPFQKTFIPIDSTPTKAHTNLQLVMLRAAVIHIQSRRLDCLRRLAHRALHALLDTLLDLVSRRGRLLAHLVGVGHVQFIIRVTVVGRRISIDLVFSVLLDEVGEILNGPRAGVVDGVGFGAGREELDGGEALNLVRDVVRGCIDFGDGNLFGERGVGSVEGG